jgi:O-antigen ligase
MPVAVALLGYLTLVPIALLPATGNAHDLARMVQVPVLAAIAWLSWRQTGSAATGRLRRGARGWSSVLAVAVLVTALCSTLSAPVFDQALREALLLAGLMLAGWASGRWIAAGHQSACLGAISFGSAVYAGVLLIRVILAIATSQPLDARDIVAGYVNHRFFNHVQTIAIPLLALALVNRSLLPLLRRFAAFALTVHLAVLPALGGRATALGLALGAVAMVLLHPAGARPFLKALFMACVAGLLAYATLFLVLPVWLGSAPESTMQRTAASLYSDSSRVMLWKLAWQQALEAPWLGQGPMHYAHSVNTKAAHPHNFFLQVAAEWGFPLMVICVAAAGTLVWRVSSRFRKESNPDALSEGCALGTMVVALLVDSALSGNLVMPIPQMWVALGLGWAWAWTRPSSGQAGDSSMVWARPALLLCAVGLTWLTIVAATEFIRLDEHLRRVRTELADNPRDNPRFWSHGWF